jgi:hypothetical protein
VQSKVLISTKVVEKETDECVCVWIKLYSWTLKFEFPVVLM